MVARPGTLAPRLTLAKALGAAGRPAEAATALEEALAARCRGRPWAPRLARNLLAERCRFDEAAAWEDEVAAVAPADPDLLECRARRYAATRRPCSP